MSQKLRDSVPTLDLNKFLLGSPQEKIEFANQLGEIYSDIGFVAIKNHGFNQELQDDVYSSIKTFFDLPVDIKQKYNGELSNGQRGYTGKGKEHAAGRNVGDLKEFYHIGKHIEGDDSSHYQKNIFPREVSSFESATLATYKKLEEVGKTMLSAIALYLGLEENHFENKVNKGISILRPLHYFPITNVEDVPDGAVRAAEHGDINLITVLMGASAEGLQVKRMDGKWIPITSVEDALIVNVGDMLERYTNGKLKSTIHRVVNPPKEKLKESRYSIPFFMHANPTMDLSCLKQCVSDETPLKYSNITAEEFLFQRLRDIGLIK